MQPGNMPAIHSAVARSITITVLAVRVIGIAWRDTHDCLVHRLPVSRPLDLPRIEAERIEE